MHDAVGKYLKECQSLSLTTLRNSVMAQLRWSPKASFGTPEMAISELTAKNEETALISVHYKVWLMGWSPRFSLSNMR